MSELRKRLLKDETAPAAVAAAAAPTPRPRSLRRFFLLLVVFALIFTYFMGMLTGSTPFMEGIAKSFGYEREHHYAVIIDAGSSGSRVLAYKFRVPFSVFGIRSLQLEEEYFEQSKPGLSSFAGDPEKGAQSIVHLIEGARRLVPAGQRARTPLIVRATAGLRLLPPAKADRLVDHVRLAIDKLGYDVAPDAVQVMEGSDEGIFIWYTVNLLHGTMSEYSSMAALDLGGGSTQVTYRIDTQEASHVPAADRFDVPSQGKNITLYTHSYLNLGLLAARYGILRLEANDSAVSNFTSICVDPIVQAEPWTYANKHYFVSGAANGPARTSPAGRAAAVARCQRLVRRYVLATMDWEPERPPRGSVAAMSYYYDIAADAGIIDVMTGGAVKVREYLSEAETACSAANVEQPWACLDLIYVSSLLNDVLKIDYDQTISLYKKVHGHEVSWALGLAYTTALERLKRAS